MNYLDYLFLTNPNDPNWDYDALSYSINSEIIEKYPEKFNNWNVIAFNTRLHLNFIEKHLDDLKKYYIVLVKNKNITLDFIEKHSEIPWSYWELSSCKYITENFVEKNIEKNWNWHALSENINFSLFFLDKYNKKIRFSKISFNTNLTINFINKYINKEWFFNDLTENPCITQEFIESHFDKPWNLKIIKSRFPKINLLKFKHKYSLIDLKLYWTKQNHKYFPKDIKKIVILMLFIHKESFIVSQLPRDILYYIFSFVF